MPETTDNRPPNTVIRQFERLHQIKTKLVKMGLLNGDATPSDVLDCLRKHVPADLFTTNK